MNCAYIFIGSNVERKKNYLEALRRLASLGRIVALSSVYETAPVGRRAGPFFFNGAALLETGLGARELKHALRQIEAALGRVRGADPDAPRTMDLDLVLFNRDRIEQDDLRIPDPLILERPFLAQALAEISPDYVLPRDGRTLAQIARTFGERPGGMRRERETTAEARELANEINRGELSHA